MSIISVLNLLFIVSW